MKRKVRVTVRNKNWWLIKQKDKEDGKTVLPTQRDECW